MGAEVGKSILKSVITVYHTVDLVAFLLQLILNTPRLNGKVEVGYFRGKKVCIAIRCFHWGKWTLEKKGMGQW